MSPRSALALAGMAAVLQAQEPEESGLELELYYTVESLSVVSGGVREDTELLGDVDLLLTVDLDRLVGWPGATLFLYGLALHGDGISPAAGDLQGVSNIEAPEATRLFEAWIEQELAGERLTLLAGLYDVNSELDVIPAASLFVNSAQGMGSELGSSGLNGPSTFPVTSLAARVEVRPLEEFYVRAVVADGVPGDLDDPSGTHVSFGSGEGLLLAGEVGWYDTPSEELRGRTRRLQEELSPAESRYGDFGKYALGVWGYTSELPDFSRLDPTGTPLRQQGTWGVYALAERGVLHEREDPFQGLSAFARAGIADDRANVFDGYLGAGLVYRGAIDGRDDDHLGLAVAAAHLGEGYRAASGADLESWEVAIELTYRAWLAPWLSVQPDVQYVFQPGGDPTLDDALVVGARVVLVL